MHSWINQIVKCNICQEEHIYLIRTTAGISVQLTRLKCKDQYFEKEIRIKPDSPECVVSEMEAAIQANPQEIPTVQGKEQGQAKNAPKGSS